MTKPKALLLSGYDSLSQSSWCEFIEESLSQYDWTVLKLPARYFAWRMRGAPLSFNELDSTWQSKDYAFVMATSSVDLATMQSLFPALRNIPSVLYFHDNQFEYPKSNQPQSVVDWQMVSLYSALRADKVVFNSEYNRTSFLNGLTALLRKLPDLVPKSLPDEIRQKSNVIAVPIQAPKIENKPAGTYKILWNHRWEWDKNPEGLLKFTEALKDHKIPFELVVTGQEFRKTPEALITLKQQHADVISHVGYIDSREQYTKLLNECHVVLSTAQHEFQGIAILEAVAHGCVPLLPDRLSYPEFFDKSFLYESSENSAEEAANAALKITAWIKGTLPEAPSVSSFYKDSLTSAYASLFERTI